MDECKNRAAGSLEWKEGKREKFEKWSQAQGHGGTMSLYAWEGWQARQPEIDALKEELNSWRNTAAERTMQKASLLDELVTLKAENEKLRREIQSLKRPNKLGYNSEATYTSEVTYTSWCAWRAALSAATTPPEGEPVAEIVAEDLGNPFNAARIRAHFYKEIPPIGTKLYAAMTPGTKGE